MRLAVEVAVEHAAWEERPELPALIMRALEAGAARIGLEEPAQAAVILSDDAAVRRLNLQWRGLDAPTNVLSFPSAPIFNHAPNPDGRPLGDVILAYETLAREAQESGRPFDAHAVHLALHGFLHLLGYDHQTDPDAEAMERLETLILLNLGYDDPHDDSDLL